MAEDQAQSIVASAAADVGDVEVPDLLHERVARQHAHLVELASNLIASGMDDTSIKGVVREAMRSYERELVQTILSLKAEDGRV